MVDPKALQRFRTETHFYAILRFARAKAERKVLALQIHAFDRGSFIMSEISEISQL